MLFVLWVYRSDFNSEILIIHLANLQQKVFLKYFSISWIP